MFKLFWELAKWKDGICAWKTCYLHHIIIPTSAGRRFRPHLHPFRRGFHCSPCCWQIHGCFYCPCSGTALPPRTLLLPRPSNATDIKIWEFDMGLSKLIWRSFWFSSSKVDTLIPLGLNINHMVRGLTILGKVWAPARQKTGIELPSWFLQKPGSCGRLKSSFRYWNCAISGGGPASCHVVMTTSRSPFAGRRVARAPNAKWPLNEMCGWMTWLI